MNFRTFVLAASLLFSHLAFAQHEVPRPEKSAYRINWEDIREDLAFDRKYAPADGWGYTRAVYYSKLTDGTISNLICIVLYLRAEHDGKRSPKGSIIAAYECDKDGVRLVNHFRFKYTDNAVVDGQWSFIRKYISQTGNKME